jgi:hypothetical protein
VVRGHVKDLNLFVSIVKYQIGIKYTGMDEASIRLAMENVNYTPALSVEGEKEYVDFLTQLQYIKMDNVEAFVDRFMRPDFIKEMIKR